MATSASASSASPGPSGSSTSSTVARWEFARRIKVRRQELNIPIDAVAKHLGFSRNFFSAVENERSMLSADKLDDLFDLLQFDESDRKELANLNRAARTRSWWDSEADLIGEHGARFLGLEQGASSVQTFDSLVMPGLLHLPDYARAVMGVDPHVSQVSLDEAVRVRERRKAALVSNDTTITALASEAAFRQTWTDSDLHTSQLCYVVDEAERRQEVEIRVLRFHTPPGILAVSSTLALLAFASPHLPDVCYQEAVRDFGILEDGTSQFQRLRIAYDEALERALSHTESIEFLRRLLDGRNRLDH